jgi:hypothetical protein
MRKFHARAIFSLLSILAVLALVACGSGGDGGASAGSSDNSATTAVEGIAAAGAPLSGTVRLRDSSYPVRETTAAITQDGSFSVKVTGMQAPFLLSATASDGTVLYSFAKAPGSAHINPLTTLAVYAAAGAAGPSALSDIFENHNLSTMKGISATLPGVLSEITSTLEPLLNHYGAAGADPFAGSYAVNHQGLDGLFDQVSFSVTDGMAVIRRRDTSAVLFTAPVTAISSGTVITAAMPSPKNYYKPGNAVLTLAMRGELPDGTRIKNLTLSLKLPLGVTADQGASGINTAIPIETAAGSNAYPQPSLSSANNTLKISISSLAGFTTGNFVKVRLIVSTEALLSTIAADFSVISASVYSDIYKNERLKGLTVEPVALTFPTREGKNTYESKCAGCHTLAQSDSTITPSLYRKTDLVAERLTTTHHTVSISADELENLIAYLTAYFAGQQVF